MKLSEATRRDIIDGLVVAKIPWSGRLEDQDFLARLFDLEQLPSTDGRFANARDDIWKHRVMNNDWEDDWVFYDGRFNLLKGDDEVFLRFLCETVHPVVRSDPDEVQRLHHMFNEHLRRDGYELVERTRMSDRPVFAARRITLPAGTALKSAREVFRQDNTTYVLQQITRMEAAVEDDPALAIGTAKELLETCCKTILPERGAAPAGNLDLPQLVKQVAKALELTPQDIPDKAKAAETIRRVLSNLATVTQGIAELRNQYGTGHGRKATAKGLQPRHAKLVAGAASALAVFLLETHQAKPASNTL